MSNTVLSGEELACYRDERCLFRQLDFSIHSQQLLLIEGRNGSGKTTLLKIICGLRQPDEGAIHWCGQPISEDEITYAQSMVYVGHNDGVKRELTVAENIRLAQKLLPHDDSELTMILKQLHLSTEEESLAANLSAGQRRRVALARVLYSGANLWILDEPFTALDRHTTAFLEERLQQHLRAGGMAVMTSHQEVKLPSVDVQTLELSA